MKDIGYFWILLYESSGDPSYIIGAQKAAWKIQRLPPSEITKTVLRTLIFCSYLRMSDYYLIFFLRKFSFQMGLEVILQNICNHLHLYQPPPCERHNFAILQPNKHISRLFRPRTFFFIEMQKWVHTHTPLPPIIYK